MNPKRELSVRSVMLEYYEVHPEEAESLSIEQSRLVADSKVKPVESVKPKAVVKRRGWVLPVGVCGVVAVGLFVAYFFWVSMGVI